MKAAILIAIVAALFLPVASANPWPTIPLQSKPITSEEVKNYWINKLPRPTKPRSLDKYYKQKMSSYRMAVSAGRHKINQVRSGHYDEDAAIAALEHNKRFYFKQGDHAKAAAATKELAVLLEARAAIIEARASIAAAEAAARAASRPPQVVVHEETEVIYIEEEVDHPKPNPRPPRPCPPPKPPKPDKPSPKKPEQCPTPSKTPAPQPSADSSAGQE